MTINDIMKQAQALSTQDRKELVKMLVDSLDASEPAKEEVQEHWGQSLNRLLDKLGPIDLIDPEIEDPVEWVKAQRQKETDRLKPYWDGEK